MQHDHALAEGAARMQAAIRARGERCNQVEGVPWLDWQVLPQVLQVRPHLLTLHTHTTESSANDHVSAW